MSNEVNTNWLEEGAMWAEVYTSTSLGSQLEVAVKNKDLDRVMELVTIARREDEEYDRRAI